MFVFRVLMKSTYVLMTISLKLALKKNATVRYLSDLFVLKLIRRQRQGRNTKFRIAVTSGTGSIGIGWEWQALNVSNC